MFKKLLTSLGLSRADEDPDLSRFLAPAQGVPLIRLESVGKVFSAGDAATQALKEVSIEVERGEFVTVEGPSGCGKSTLLHIMGLLERPSEGTYRLNGTPVVELKPSQLAQIRNRSVGFIFQNFNLIGDLTVFENVETPLTYVRMAIQERRERVMNALERVGMQDFAKRYPSQITGGQQQRVAVARAVAPGPQILLADEPTGNLDSRNGEAVMGLLQELHSNGATLCLVTHNPEFALRSQRVIYLFDGKTCDAPPEGALPGG